MNKILLLLLIVFGLLFVFGCSNISDNNLKTTVENPLDNVDFSQMTSYVVLDNEATANTDQIKVIDTQDIKEIKEITIRSIDGGFSPDIISVNKGDRVVMYITNTMSDTGDGSRIGITGFPIEEYYYTGNTVYFEFVADKTGVFEFGDESKNSPKGKLIVI